VASTGDACRDSDDGTHWRRDGSGTVREDARRQAERASGLMVRRRGGLWPAANVPIA
jgi:hypothetical protein